MSSGAQAQAAASQVATQAQAEANRNALDFAKEVYGYEQQARSPYLQGGAAGMGELLTLLGLAPMASSVGSRSSGTGLLTSNSGATRRAPTSGSGGGGGGSGPAPLQSGPGPTPSDPYQAFVNNEQGLGRVVLPPVQSGAPVTMTAPDGTTRLVPESLVPYFQERGLSVQG